MLLILGILFGLWVWHDAHPDFGQNTSQNVPKPPETAIPSDQSSPDTVPSSNTATQTALTPHQRRLADLRNKQQAAEMSILIERETIKTTLQRDGIEGIPDDEHVRVQRLIREKESIDAAIREEEQNAGSEPAPVTSTVSQTLAPVISVDATSLLAAYQADEKATTARYENRKLAVTGVLSGVFIPPASVLMRAAWDFHPSAFVTMGGPHASSVQETLFLPGIKAYSENSSLFGQRNPLVIADRIRIGETVTVVCKDPVASRVSDLIGGATNGNADYSVILEDCTLQTPPEATAEPNENPAPIAASIPHASLRAHDEKPLSAPAPAPDIVKGSVSVGVSAYPSIQIPPELKGQISRGGAKLQVAQLVSRVEPVYPQEAQQQRIEGTVKLHAIIGRDGSIHAIENVSGPPLLVPAATTAVRQWRYRPTSLNGRPVEAGEDITMVFRLKVVHPN
jgi:protein TonB